jgi:hypothetical protein
MSKTQLLEHDVQVSSQSEPSHADPLKVSYLADMRLDFQNTS